MERCLTGLDRCLRSGPTVLDGRTFGLVCNQASLSLDGQYAHYALAERFPTQLRRLFGPQHGFWSVQQDNMVETDHAIEPRLGLPIHSLYGSTRWPDDAWLDDLDVLVIDLQDVGTRVYTYVWTMLYCMEACARRELPIVVLDRPNPIGGELAEGPLLAPGFESFVGRACIPMRHGLTMGELALWLNANHELNADVQVVELLGWSRAAQWPSLGRTWHPTSPNLPRYTGTLVYPGQVLLEGTQLSEGRGSTTPFELFGAPWIEPLRLIDALPDLPGVRLRPAAFEPTFNKHAGKTCGSLFLDVRDPRVFRPYRATLVLLRTIAELWPDEFRWLQPPYEYESKRMPIDILSGSSVLRDWVNELGSWSQLDALSTVPESWYASTAPHRLYG